MSLIERAVARLTEVKRQPDTPPASPSGEVSANRQQNSIETLSDRLADVANGPQITPRASPPSAAVIKPDMLAPTPLSSSGPAQTTNPASVPSPEPVRIHLEALRARGMVVSSGPANQIGQEFRVIKRPLLTNAYGRGDRKPAPRGRCIMVTSAFPGEGKSFCAVNLAMSIAAERDHGVILIDADVARPSIPRELGIQVDKGLMDWLIDGSPDLGQLVLPTNVDTLSILPAGRHHEQATELLASEAMGRLLNQLSERYPDRIFIFDSPPLLVTTEARVLASHMGQIVMVVEAGKTPRDSVSQALSTIESNEIVGLVLNKANNIESSGYYYQGYGYGSSA